MQGIKKFLYSIFVLFLLGGGYTYAQESPLTEEPLKLPVVIKIGVTQDLDSQILSYIKNEVQTQYDITLEIIRFESTNSANRAVADGVIDGNISQTEQYFKSYLEEYQYNVASLGKLYVRPIGLYSKKYSNLASVPKDATIILLQSDMGDDTILGRELLLLQKAGLLALKNNPKTHSISTFDVIQDNRKVLFKNALTAGSLLDSYINDEADLFVLDQSTASKINDDRKHLLVSEDVDSLYPRILVVKMDNKNIKHLRQIYDVITSTDTANYIRETYPRELLPINK